MKFSDIKLPLFGNKNNEGPPDLDEVFRDLNNKISALFGKKPSGDGNQNGGFGGNAAPNKPLDLPIIPILLLLAGIWLATGFYIVDQGSVGVVQRFGNYVETTEPGPRWHWPIWRRPPSGSPLRTGSPASACARATRWSGQ